MSEWKTPDSRPNDGSTILVCLDQPFLSCECRLCGRVNVRLSEATLHMTADRKSLAGCRCLNRCRFQPHPPPRPYERELEI
jgi:hypothetical protein